MPRWPKPLASPCADGFSCSAAAGLVPVVIMSGVGLYVLARQQRTQAERIGLELARALATAVDAELRSSISVLQSLATTVEIDRRNLTAFRQQVQPVLETQPTWAALFLADPSGHASLDTRFPLDATCPDLRERASFERVVRTRAARCGNLARGSRRRHAVPGAGARHARRPRTIRADRAGQARGILNVITRQRVPRDWIISIFDANGLRVARSRAHAETLGGRASESLQTLMATSADEGVGQTTDLEGGRNYASFSRLGDYGWTVAPGIAAGFVEGVAYRSLAIYGSGILLSVVLGLLGTMAVARSVSRPMEALRGMAKAMGRREPAPPISTPIQEIHDVADALIAAARERTSAETEREQLLRREQDARADRGGGQPGEGRVPGRPVARAAHAAERGLRLGAAAAVRPGPRRGGRRARSTPSCATPTPRCS